MLAPAGNRRGAKGDADRGTVSIDRVITGRRLGCWGYVLTGRVGRALGGCNAPNALRLSFSLQLSCKPLIEWRNAPNVPILAIPILHLDMGPTIREN